MYMPKSTHPKHTFCHNAKLLFEDLANSKFVPVSLPIPEEARLRFLHQCPSG